MSVFRYELNKILEKEQERIFLWYPVVFAAGILSYFSLRFEPSIWWSLAVVEILIIAAYLWRQNVSALMVISWAAVFVLGFVNIQARAYHIHHVPLLKNELVSYLKGYVTSSGYTYRGRRYLLMTHLRDFDDQPLAGAYRITLMQPAEDIGSGDCVELVASLRPLMMPNMINGYQFNRQQFFQGIKGTGYSDVSVHRIACSEIGIRAGYFLPKIERIRQALVTKIYAVLPPETAGVAAAVIAGERGRISVQQTEAYRDAGLAHFLAISGLHMGMLAGLMFWLVRTIASYFPAIALRYDTKKIAAVVAILMSFIYLVISGWQISTQRAFIMTTLVLCGILVGRRAISMRMVAWAGLILLIFEPQMIISAGFQMSFAAVIMLVAFYEKHVSFSSQSQRYKSIYGLCKTIVLYLVGIVVADFVASMATLPFVIYHFNRISLYTSLANLLAGPIIALWIMPAVLFSLLLWPLGLEKISLWIVGQGIAQVNQITDYVAHLPHASYQVVSMPSWGLMLIVFGGLWLAIWQSKWRHWGWLLVLLGYLSILTVKFPDVLTDAGAKSFAVKNNQGRMVILPNRGNYFTKQMWSEKLALASLTENQRKKLRSIYQGKMTDVNVLPLVCDKKSCVYKNKIVLMKRGGLMIEGKDFSDEGALAVYDIGKKLQVYTVRNALGTRYWTVE